MRNGSALNSPMKELRKDLHSVARDAEALLKATADVAGDRVQEARARTQQSLRHSLEHLYDHRIGQDIGKRAKKLARNTDTYVRHHPWTVLGAVAGVALVIGLLSRRD